MTWNFVLMLFFSLCSLIELHLLMILVNLQQLSIYNCIINYIFYMSIIILIIFLSTHSFDQASESPLKLPSLAKGPNVAPKKNVAWCPWRWRCFFWIDVNICHGKIESCFVQSVASPICVLSCVCFVRVTGFMKAIASSMEPAAMFPGAFWRRKKKVVEIKWPNDRGCCLTQLGTCHENVGFKQNVHQL